MSIITVGDLYDRFFEKTGFQKNTLGPGGWRHEIGHISCGHIPGLSHYDLTWSQEEAAAIVENVLCRGDIRQDVFNQASCPKVPTFEEVNRHLFEMRSLAQKKRLRKIIKNQDFDKKISFNKDDGSPLSVGELRALAHAQNIDVPESNSFYTEISDEDAKIIYEKALERESLIEEKYKQPFCCMSEEEVMRMSGADILLDRAIGKEVIGFHTEQTLQAGPAGFARGRG